MSARAVQLVLPALLAKPGLQVPMVQRARQAQPAILDRLGRQVLLALRVQQVLLARKDLKVI